MGHNVSFYITFVILKISTWLKYAFEAENEVIIAARF